jgi:predicted Zn-dependent protease
MPSRDSLAAAAERALIKTKRDEEEARLQRLELGREDVLAMVCDATMDSNQPELHALHRSVIAALQANFPDDGRWIQYKLRSAIRDREFDLALQTIELAKKRYHDDAYLDVVRANVLLLQGHPDAAADAASAALKSEPDLAFAYKALLEAHVRSGDLAGAKELARQAEVAQVDLSLFSGDEDLAPLWRSAN